MSQHTLKCSAMPPARYRLMLYAISMRLALVCVAILLLTSCASMSAQVQAPPLDLPPIPAQYTRPCEEPMPLQKGTTEEMYLQMLQDAVPWGRCVRDHDSLIAIVKYIEEITARWKVQAAKLAQPGWKWPWQ